MATEFETFEVPGARSYFGYALPYGLQVRQNETSNAPPVAESAAALRALGESGKLQELLDQHGAVLIRGVGRPSAETFSKLVGAAEQGRGSRPHVQIGLAGGATPIANSANVFEKVQAEIPELVEEIRKRGLGMKMVFRAPGDEAKVNQFNWAGEHSFGQELLPDDDDATTRQKVERQVKKLTSDFKWNDDGSLELTQHIPDLCGSMDLLADMALLETLVLLILRISAVTV
ncbi:hypothetical protein ColLi_03367 [Colletotrichum liriopes]|uniref:Uncharacterized protein n=1 Tax=Colletotrichum liriopes TaxID=708192 RepID=A0AA37LPW7_9PEZI|nr:hypothetical protein ColLi_03367 [Colletotrichum liriopes]